MLGAVLAGVVLTGGLAATQWVATAAIGARDMNIEQYTFIYDLAALSGGSARPVPARVADAGARHAPR